MVEAPAKQRPKVRGSRAQCRFRISSLVAAVVVLAFAGLLAEVGPALTQSRDRTFDEYTEVLEIEIPVTVAEAGEVALDTTVFDTTDRVQHMFYRYLDPTHPANAGKDTEVWKDAIGRTYERTDELLGKIMHLTDDPNTVLMVISDIHDEDAIPALKLVAQEHECVVLQLQDPAERGRVGGGIFRAREAESNTAFVAHGRRGSRPAHHWRPAA